MTPETSTPQISGETVYLAFRVAFLSTFETLVDELAHSESASKGFLEHIPLATGCAPQVQIDCLLKTWKHIYTCHSLPPGAVGQLVCYGATAELARQSELDNRRLIRVASGGPTPAPDVDCLWLASKIRSLQITWPVQIESMNVLRDSRLLSADLDSPDRGQVGNDARQELLEIVGAWQVSPQILSNGEGLISAAERGSLGSLLQKHPRLMNL